MYNNWLQKLNESYVNSKIELTESEMILEELNETKEYAYILEHVLNTLLEHEVINEEIIMEVLTPHERDEQAKRMGLSDEEAGRRWNSRRSRLQAIENKGDELIKKHSSGLPLNSLDSAKWSQIQDILRASRSNSNPIDRRVPEGSPEEDNIVHRGLVGVGIFKSDPNLHTKAKKQALDSIRFFRKENKRYNAEDKRGARAREREQRKQGN